VSKTFNDAVRSAFLAGVAFGVRSAFLAGVAFGEDSDETPEEIWSWLNGNVRYTQEAFKRWQSEWAGTPSGGSSGTDSSGIESHLPRKGEPTSNPALRIAEGHQEGRIIPCYITRKENCVYGYHRTCTWEADHPEVEARRGCNQ
jgi:hypothetical protein